MLYDSFVDDNLPSEHLRYGWSRILQYHNSLGVDKHHKLYGEMVDWINSNIYNPRSNVLWDKLGDCIYLQFRKEKDMMWFILRWG